MLFFVTIGCYKNKIGEENRMRTIVLREKDANIIERLYRVKQAIDF